ncbi:hypothetical protein SAMN05444392_1016 [Seinonella peptonophila]|uniref:Major facilitator superfamily (MFS) profile domain-containing protein n=1 Tax=Seinonella peptonophila TaxID=112248 RepID=A0A1M4SJM5_9BACL|nr:hypothetical protein [Seinonella peptonophila]SHE32395.1 hypothetical protein SAMN05444392_1016 [Seinonella peptonophila]
MRKWVNKLIPSWLTGTLFCLLLGAGINEMQVAYIRVVQEIHLNKQGRSVGFFESGYWIGLGVGGLMAIQLVDRFPPKKVVCVSSLIGMVSTILSVFFQRSFEIFFIWILLGISSSICAASSILWIRASISGSLSPTQQEQTETYQTKGRSLMITFMIIGDFLSMVLVDQLLSRVPYRWLLIIGVAINLLEVGLYLLVPNAVFSEKPQPFSWTNFLYWPAVWVALGMAGSIVAFRFFMVYLPL